PRPGPASREARRPPSGNRASRSTRRPGGNCAAPASAPFLSRALAATRNRNERTRILSRMSLPPVEVRDPDDPRLADYRALKERHLNAEGGRFVAESERVVRRLLESPLRVRSVLVTPPRLRALEDALRARRAADGAAAPWPLYVAEQDVLDAIAGFHVHRGCLAIGERPASRALPSGARGIVVLEDLVDVDNLGSIVRNATAF